MKTERKNVHKVAPGGARNSKQHGHRPYKKKESFFKSVPDTENKNKQHRQAHGAGKGGGGGPVGKRGPGVKKTAAFKPKRNFGGNDRRHEGNKHTGKPGGPRKGQCKNQQGGRGGPKQGQHKNQHAGPAKSAVNFAQLFQSKPEKINYCLVPELVEAQAKAIKHFEQKEKEKEIESRKEQRARQHQLMTKKTRKGQPALHGRMELLLEKVKKTVGVQ